MNKIIRLSSFQQLSNLNQAIDCIYTADRNSVAGYYTCLDGNIYYVAAEGENKHVRDSLTELMRDMPPSLRDLIFADMPDLGEPFTLEIA